MHHMKVSLLSYTVTNKPYDVTQEFFIHLTVICTVQYCTPPPYRSSEAHICSTMDSVSVADYTQHLELNTVVIVHVKLKYTEIHADPNVSDLNKHM